MRKFYILCAVLSTCLVSMQAQKSEKEIIKNLEQKSETYGTIAQNIWELAEMGYQENQSSGLLQKTLQDAGFSIKKGVAGIPTAFIAEYGNGTPVIAIMG